MRRTCACIRGGAPAKLACGERSARAVVSTRMHATGEARRRSLPADATGAAARLQGSRPRHKHLPS
jgi:hypothetical protein